jgi:hypothetical protein
MRKVCCLLVLLIEIGGSSGCAKPVQVLRVNSPVPGVFFTIETSYSRGPAAADFTRIYAHLRSNGYSDKVLVLDGQYLQHTKIVWFNSQEVTLCIPEGYTQSFRNYVVLRAGDVSKSIHASIQEHCGSEPSAR